MASEVTPVMEGGGRISWPDVSTSIIIAAHNEGERLLWTVESVREVALIFRMEIIVADDASSDGSIAELQRLFEEVRVVGNRERLGPSPTKDLGARSSQGEILIFLDGHTKPEDGALFRLVERVKEARGQAIFTPRVLQLDAETWTNKPAGVGLGHRMALPTFDCGWMGSKELRHRGPYYESPSLCGCAFAISRDLYDELCGFDPGMREWGLEDLDLGLKSWLADHPVLVDPLAAVGHLFREKFSYQVSVEHVLANKMRTARKNFTDRSFDDWCRVLREQYREETWALAGSIYRSREESVERERESLLARRVHDEFWYARRFDLGWPVGEGDS